MQLTVRDAAKFLAVSERTVYRWVRQGFLPAHHLHNQVLFNRAELIEWATGEHLPVASELTAGNDLDAGELPTVADALSLGGIHTRVPGHDKASALKAVVERLDLPASLSRESLWQILLAREALGSTGVGEGIAIPHARNPIILHGIKPAIALSLLANPVDFAAVDHRPVDVLFLLLSPTVPVHLHLLSRLSFILRDPGFREALAQRQSTSQILDQVRQAEASLDEAERSA